MGSISYAIPVGSTILVTGANGYIASHVCDILLSLGYRVRGTVRSEKPWLDAFFEEKYGAGRFESIVVPNLVETEPWQDIIAGVDGVAHVASDLSMNNDPDAVVPKMIKMVVNALEAAQAEPSVKRVVLTSSSTAAFISVPNKEGVRITDDTWFDSSIEKAWSKDTPEDEKGFAVYCASKTLGEKEAWKWVEQHKPNFGFNVIVPNTNYGKILCPEQPGSTMSWTANLLKGDDFVVRSFPPQWYVNVEDTARLHVIALLNPSVINKRIWAFAGKFNWTDIITTLQELRPDNKLLLPCPKNEGRDLSDVVGSAEAEAMIKEFFGRSGWVGLKETLADGIEGRW
ncbi:hypothetical protein BJY04DRAFT_231200 [Aspergillus karnatakaensis]|uniref:uncharacterized protein n=1 Tax=Aspergillus karnatakaensis TaxID=1810916 RepID=UPI003CCCA953